MSDLRVIRDRQADAGDDLDRAEVRPSNAGRTDVAITTTELTYPTAAGAWYSVTSQRIDGTEAEGASATFATTSGVFHAFNLGSKVPPAGTIVLIHCIGGKWSFRYDG
jgi:hypothetical protein